MQVAECLSDAVWAPIGSKFIGVIYVSLPLGFEGAVTLQLEATLLVPLNLVDFFLTRDDFFLWLCDLRWHATF